MHMELSTDKQPTNFSKLINDFHRNFSEGTIHLILFYTLEIREQPGENHKIKNDNTKLPSQFLN